MFKLLCVIGLRSIGMVFYARMQLVQTTIKVNKDVERFMLEMQHELETVLWSKKELEARLQVATKERQHMDLVATELEEEHEKAIVKIELLENEVQKLKAENIRLREIQGKGFYEAGRQKTVDTHKDYVPCRVSSWKLSDNGIKLLTGDHLTPKHSQETLAGTRTGLKPNVPVDPGMMPSMLWRNLNSDEAAVQQKEVALYRSLFSSILSLIVGLVIWKYEAPCVPLVMGLFSVVGMSLKSVVRFFSSMKIKGA